jgi:hypothetical protein
MTTLGDRIVLPLKNFEPPSETRSETFRNAQQNWTVSGYGLPELGSVIKAQSPRT